MPVTIPDKPREPPLWQRLAWFVTLYLVGVGTVGAVAFGLRLWLKP